MYEPKGFSRDNPKHPQYNIAWSLEKASFGSRNNTWYRTEYLVFLRNIRKIYPKQILIYKYSIFAIMQLSPYREVRNPKNTITKIHSTLQYFVFEQWWYSVFEQCLKRGYFLKSCIHFKKIYQNLMSFHTLSRIIIAYEDIPTSVLLTKIKL